MPEQTGDQRMTTLTNMIDENAWQVCMRKMLGDFGAATSRVLVLIGWRLGLDKALPEHGPFSAEIPFNLFVEARR